MNAGIKSPYVPNVEEGFGRFSKDEILSLKVFKSEPLLSNLLRKVWLQKELSQNETDTLKKHLSGTLLFKTINKIWDEDADESGMINGSKWSDRRFADLISAEVKPTILGRQDSIRFTEAGLARLKDLSEGGAGRPLPLLIDMNLRGNYENMPAEEVKRHAVAFQDSMIFLERSIGFIESMANREMETEEQKKERLKKDDTR